MPSSPSGSTRSAKSARLLFRREAQYMLSTPIPSPSRRPVNGSVEVVASVERDSSAGLQQSVHLCRAGEEEWVTRTQGETTYFPPLARVQGSAQKRARAAEVEEDAEDAGDAEDAEDAPVAAKASKSSRRSKRRHGADTNSEEERPVVSSSARRAASDAANKKHPKPRRPDDDNESFDDGASAEVEQSHLGRRAPQSSSSSSTALGRGQRRCTGRTFVVKKEHDDADDLASLCGRVDGLEVRGTVDPESECERTPMPTTAGRRRA